MSYKTLIKTWFCFVYLSILCDFILHHRRYLELGMQLGGRGLGGQNPRSNHCIKKTKRLLVKGFLHLLYDYAPSFTKAQMVSIQTKDRHEYFVVSMLLGSGISMPSSPSPWAVSRSPSSLTLALWPHVGPSRAVTTGACVPSRAHWSLCGSPDLGPPAGPPVLPRALLILHVFFPILPSPNTTAPASWLFPFLTNDLSTVTVAKLC